MNHGLGQFGIAELNALLEELEHIGAVKIEGINGAQRATCECGFATSAKDIRRTREYFQDHRSRCHATV